MSKRLRVLGRNFFCFGGGDLFYKVFCYVSGQLDKLEFLFFVFFDMCFSCSGKEMCYLWFGFKSGKLVVYIFFMVDLFLCLQFLSLFCFKLFRSCVLR